MLRRTAAFVGVVIIGMAGTALPAWAHVTVAPDSAPKGASDVEITFRVPNEDSSASTTKLDVAIPSSPPLLNALAQSVPGWTDNVKTTHLSTPIHTDDGDVTDVVTEVSWTANSAAYAIKPGEFGRFEIIVGSLPTSADQIVFKALQTYSNGKIVRWIDPVTPSGPAPANPTPILNLTSPTTAPTGTATATTTPTATGSALPAHVASKSDADSARTIGIIAVVLAALALIGVAISLTRKRPATR
jgi:uncharacterized protein YcnI